MSVLTVVQVAYDAEQSHIYGTPFLYQQMYVVICSSRSLFLS